MTLSAKERALVEAAQERRAIADDDVRRELARLRGGHHRSSKGVLRKIDDALREHEDAMASLYTARRRVLQQISELQQRLPEGGS